MLICLSSPVKLRTSTKQVLKSGFLHMVGIIIPYCSCLFIFLHPSQNCKLNERSDSALLAFIIVLGTQSTLNKYLLNEWNPTALYTAFYLLMYLPYTLGICSEVAPNPWFIRTVHERYSFSSHLSYSNVSSFMARTLLCAFLLPTKLLAQSSVLKAK